MTWGFIDWTSGWERRVRRASSPLERERTASIRTDTSRRRKALAAARPRPEDAPVIRIVWPMKEGDGKDWPIILVERLGKKERDQALTMEQKYAQGEKQKNDTSMNSKRKEGVLYLALDMRARHAI